MFLRMLGDGSGAAAAEYALILAVVGSVLAIAALNLSGSIAEAGKIKAVGPGGVTYTCTGTCQYEYVDYCAIVGHKGDLGGAIITPALAENAACDDEGKPLR